MKFFKTFEIEVIKFKEGRHEIDFQIENSFFQNFEDNELVKEGQLNARVIMDKGPHLIDMSFQISGLVKLICDRSLEAFDQTLSFTEKIIYKYGLEEQEVDENIIMITRDTSIVNVAQLIYEFILLALPLKKIHPAHRNELDEEDYEGEGNYAYLDTALQMNEEDMTSDEIGETIDPRWESLKKLKNKE